MWELTQFSFAKGEQTVLDIRYQAEAIETAVNASFSKEPDAILKQLWDQLMSRVNYQVPLSEEDYIAHNDQIAEQFLPRKID